MRDAMVKLTRRAALAVAGAAGGTVLLGALARKLAVAPGSSDDGATALLGRLAGLPAETPGLVLPAFRFTTAEGAARTLADYAGQGIVLNLWATWWEPCVTEMPALDQLARLVADDRIAVLPLSSDRAGAPAVVRFYRDNSIRRLPVLLDAEGAAARALGARGIPTTLIVDRAGRERGRLEGAQPWSDAQAVAAIRRAVIPA
jgi:thiol-disulfide isomerase/thioredoxin